MPPRLLRLGHFAALPLIAAMCCGVFATGRTAAGADPDAELRVMSFNIRYGTASDGENNWLKRRDFLIDTIRAFDPDLLGTQETLDFQRDYIAEHLEGYDHFSAGRNDGKEAGEMAAVFYRAARFEKLDGGHFWLSETPDVPGSKSWDSALTRIVTWVKLRDRQNSRARPLVFFNTHFDHMGQEARLRSAELLRRRIDDLAPETPVVVTGDFNCGENAAPHAMLFGLSGKERSRVIDTYRAAHPDPQAGEGTFSAFKAGPVDGARIDWIGCSRGFRVLTADIDRTEREGRTPSDHFPVTAILELGSSP
jgi:endonuclease/exonuclease/phosphatase family metal-dependent hydrolase